MPPYVVPTLLTHKMENQICFILLFLILELTINKIEISNEKKTIPSVVK